MATDPAPRTIAGLQRVLASGDTLDREVGTLSVVPTVTVHVLDGVGISLPLSHVAIGLALTEAQHRLGDVESALATLTNLPLSTVSLLAQAEVLVGQSEHARVVGLGSVEVADEISAVYTVFRAGALRECYRVTEALDELDRVLDLDDAPLARRLALVERARCHLAQGRIIAADRDLTNLLAEHPTETAALAVRDRLEQDGWWEAETLSAEAAELARREAELASLEAEIVEAEVALVSLQGELDEFDRRHLDVLGERYLRLDELEAEYAEAVARIAPSEEAMARAREAREQARRTHEDFTQQQAAAPPSPPPSDELKALFRELAKRLHPDHALNDEDRAERETWMKQLTGAWAEREYDTVRRIERQTRDRTPPSGKPDDAGTRLVSVLRAIRVERWAVRDVTSQLDHLEMSAVARLRDAVDEAARNGSDLLAEMAADLDSKIAQRKRELRRLKKDKIPGEARA